MRIAIVATALLAVLAGCAQSSDPWVASQRLGEVPQVPEPTEEDYGFQTAREVFDQLPSALKNFEGSFPDTRRSSVLKRLQRTFATMERNAALDDPKGPASYAPGYAESIVVMEWQCSWEGAYLRAYERNDAAGATRAGAQLATLYDLEYAKLTIEDPERGWETEVLKPALRGDTRPMAAEYKMCAAEPS